MYENDVWSGLADFLANMIEKYAGEMDLDALPDPRQQSRLKGIEEVYRRYMRLSAEARQAALLKNGHIYAKIHVESMSKLLRSR